MNRSVVVVKSLIFAIALGVSVFLAGCEEFAKEEEFYTIKTTPQQTREIQTLKLEPKADGNRPVDVNEPIEVNKPAQSDEIKSLTEYQIAQIDLSYATGMLLGAAKVRWEPSVSSADTTATAPQP